MTLNAQNWKLLLHDVLSLPNRAAQHEKLEQLHLEWLKNPCIHPSTSSLSSMSTTITTSRLRGNPFLSLLDILCDDCETFDLSFIEMISRIGKLSYPSPSFARVLNTLVEQLVCTTDAITCAAPCNKLRFLAVVLDGNTGVQMYINELKSIKQFYRYLTLQLNGHLVDSIYSIGCLVRLLTIDPFGIGPKLFQRPNVIQAFESIFKVLNQYYEQQEVITTVFLIDTLHVMHDLGSQASFSTVLEKHKGWMEVVKFCFEHITKASHGLRNPDRRHESTSIAVYFLIVSCQFNPQLRQLLAQGLVPNIVGCLQVMEEMDHDPLGIDCAHLIYVICKENNQVIDEIANASTEEKTKVRWILQSCVERLNSIDIAQEELLSKPTEAAQLRYASYTQLIQLLNLFSNTTSLALMLHEKLHFEKCVDLVQQEAFFHSEQSNMEVEYSPPNFSIALFLLLVKLNMVIEQQRLQDPFSSDRDGLSVEVTGLMRLLKSTAVANIIGAGLVHNQQKETISKLLLALFKCMNVLPNGKYLIQCLTDGIYANNQRLFDLISNLSQLKSTAESHAQTQSRLVEEQMQTIAGLNLEIRTTRSDYETKLKTLQDHSIRESEATTRQLQKRYDNELVQLKQQCENLVVSMQKKLQSNQEQEKQLGEARRSEMQLKDDKLELEKKLKAVEMRLEQVAQSHIVAKEEVLTREQEYLSLRNEMDHLSDILNHQTLEREKLTKDNKSLSQNLATKTKDLEDQYQELVIFAKLHHEEQTQLAQDRQGFEDQLKHVRGQNEALETQLGEYKQKVQAQETQLAAIQTSLAHQEEQTATFQSLHQQSQAQVHTLEQEHMQHMLELGMKQVEMETQTSQLDRAHEELETLRQELENHQKLQALINKLSTSATSMDTTIREAETAIKK